MALFIGSNIVTIDNKGRIVLPSLFKKAMGELPLETIILEKNETMGCLDIHTEDSWEKKVDNFSRPLDEFSPEDNELLQEFFERFTTVSVASNGRINIPNDFLEFAGLTTKVKFVGMRNVIRIINADKNAKPKMDSDLYNAKVKETRTRKPKAT